jgi:midasin
MQSGEWVLLDEMNLASQSVLEGLNSCLDHRGEVYVAELDQKFSRHPGFRLFATQNPHHQGGGRKGLPASFVNRFTVVFADAFEPTDMQVICGTLFPKVNKETIAQVIEFVTSLNNALSVAKCFGADGAPWEINLRDIIRWLKLLCTVPGNLHVSNFVDVIIQQRFRKVSDRQHIIQLFNQTFGKPVVQRSFFHNLTPMFYQAGLGILHRNTLSQALESKNFLLYPDILPVIESLLLCIQFNWPCILVGPSGCGKSKVLHHLASISGTNLVEIAMNPEIDTLDLVGGFEQVDSRRQLSTFQEDLQNYVQHRIICMTKDHAEKSWSRALLEIMRLSSSPFPLLSKLLSLLVQVATGSQDCMFEDLADRCRALGEVQQNVERLQFEWTDGILIDSLQNGHWVVLDNANLCSSSVLDRLNSLLEPDGSLLVNEKLDSDGKAQVVKPHPNFRIFLTMDPRHGELSRAMRNRAIEIFFLQNDNPMNVPEPPLSYNCESSMDRFRYFQSMNWNKIDPTTIDSLYEDFFNHYSGPDYKLIQRWARTVKAGLCPLEPEMQASFEKVVDRYQCSAFSDETLEYRQPYRVEILQRYESFERSLNVVSQPLTFQVRKTPIILPYNADVLYSPCILLSMSLMCHP